MCKLYYEVGGQKYLLGTFGNQKKAEAFWNLMKDKIWNLYGSDKPIYVEQ